MQGSGSVTTGSSRSDDVYPVDLPLASPVPMLEWCAASCPGLVAAVNLYNSGLAPLISEVADSEAHPATTLVVTQLINDLNDTIFDAMAGRGRSALRSARAVFEHLLNLIAVIDDTEMADRFIAHWPVGAALLERHDPYERRFRGKDLKAYRHRLKVARRQSASEAADSLRTYGDGFAQRWHPHTTRARAEAAGLGEHYAFYRAASQAAHGSPVGGVGTFWLTDGRPAARVGPALSPCSVALSAVLEYGSLAMGVLAPRFASAVSVAGAIERIGAEVIDLARYCMAVDAQLGQEGA